MSTENQQSVERAIRTITIYATKGEGLSKIQSDAKTWLELKKEISDNYDLGKLIATENVRRTDLVSDTAILPEGDFTLFLKPKETKSGSRSENMSYKDIKATIKNDLELYGDSAKDHYNAGGKSYTNKSTNELKSLVDSFVIPGEEATVDISAQVEVVEEVILTDAEKLAKVKEILTDITESSKNEALVDKIECFLEEEFLGLEIELENEEYETSQVDAEEEARIAEENQRKADTEQTKAEWEKTNEEIAAEKKRLDKEAKSL